MPAILFGSISTLADTSELQRAAFNDAFAEHGLDWRWEREDYRALLTGNGGRDRIAQYADDHDTVVDADAVHATKSRLFQNALADSPVPLRDGVVATVTEARQRGWRVGLVTTTSPANVDALLTSAGDELDRELFDVIVDATDVDSPKPDAAAYRFALDTLGEAADACLAVEDNVGGVESAAAAGVTVVAFPNENTAGHDFGDTRGVTRLDLDELAAGVPGADA